MNNIFENGKLIGQSCIKCGEVHPVIYDGVCSNCNSQENIKDKVKEQNEKDLRTRTTRIHKSN